MILPNGTLARASETAHPDLYLALRGGGSNFGIVTDFEMDAHKQDQIWSGSNTYLVEDLPELLAVSGVHHQFDWTLHSATIMASRLLQKLAVKLGYGMSTSHLVSSFVELANCDECIDAHAFIYFTWVPWMRVHLSGTTVVPTDPGDFKTLRNFSYHQA